MLFAEGMRVMMGFGESVVFTSNVNGKRLRIRKEFIDVLFEVSPSKDVNGNFIPASSQITMRSNTVYTIKENYDQVEEILGRQE